MIEKIEKILKNKLVRKIAHGVSVSLGFGGALAVVASIILALFVHWAWVFVFVPCLIVTGISFGLAEYLDSAW